MKSGVTDVTDRIGRTLKTGDIVNADCEFSLLDSQRREPVTAELWGHIRQSKHLQEEKTNVCFLLVLRNPAM